MTKDKPIKWFALLFTVLMMVSLCGMRTLAVPDDEEESDPPTSVATSSEAPATSTNRPPASTSTSESNTETSSYYQTSSQSHATSTATTTTSRTTTSRASSTTTSRSAATSSSSARIGAVSDESVEASWGTGYTESDGAATTTSVASAGQKNIANYFLAMQRMIWLPILLIILSVATLIFVNVQAHRRNLSRKRRRFDSGTDIRSDSRRR